MGTFADLRWVDGSWRSTDQHGRHVLSISIHDSDIATIAFSPARGAAGLFYLGCEPAIYFEDPQASSPVDKDAEARAFAAWAADATRHHVDPAAVHALMAPSEFVPGREPVDDFVERTVEKLLTLIGLPMPDLDEAHRAAMEAAGNPEHLTASGLNPRGIARELRTHIERLLAPKPAKRRRWLGRKK